MPSREEYISESKGLDLKNKSRWCHFVIDVSLPTGNRTEALERGIKYYTVTLHTKLLTINPARTSIYRKLTIPGSEICLVLQWVPEPRTEAPAMYYIVETDNQRMYREMLKH